MGWPSIGQTINSTVSAESFARDNIIGGWRRHLGSILYGAAWHWNFIVAPPGNLYTGNLNSQLGPKSKFQASSVDTSSEEVQEDITHHRSLWYKLARTKTFEWEILVHALLGQSHMDHACLSSEFRWCHSIEIFQSQKLRWPCQLISMWFQVKQNTMVAQWTQ